MLYMCSCFDSSWFPPRTIYCKTARAHYVSWLDTSQNTPHSPTLRNIVGGPWKIEIADRMPSNYSRLLLTHIKTKILVHYMGHPSLFAHEKSKWLRFLFKLRVFSKISIILPEFNQITQSAWLKLSLFYLQPCILDLYMSCGWTV